MSGDDDDDDSPPLPSGARETRTAISCDVTELRAPGGPLDVTLPSASGGRFELIGRVLDGRYRLDRLLGVGGMGQVYAGLHLSLDVPIAVKVMHPSIAAIEENVVRFRREARASSLLRHRNVVRVLDFGDVDGVLYIVMEYLEGAPLGALLGREGPLLSLLEVEEITDQILAALEAAHSLGIVHRDLKPDNVFLTEEPGGERVVKVVDFGLALVEEARPSGERLTQADAVAGTPLYMSPEQCHSLDVTFSTDLYALGCILTEMLQAAPPFEGRTPMDVITKQLFMPPPPLRRPTSAEAVPTLLERLRNDLLAKAPDRRPGSATEARRRLEQAMDGDAAAKVLPGRQRDGRLGRELRAPSWSARDAARSVAVTAGRGGDACAIGVARLDGAIGAPALVDDACVLALRAAGFDAAFDRAEGEVAVILDAGADVAGAQRWLGSEARGRAPVIVCIRCSVTDLPTLIAAGAAEVLVATRGTGVESTALIKRLERVRRRGATAKA